MDEKEKTSEFTGSELFIGGTSIFLFIMVFIAGGALATGIITGIMSSIGLGFALLKLRSNKKGARFWNTAIENQAFADLLFSLGFIFIFGTSTATGLISAAAAAVCTSTMLTFSSKFLGKVDGVPAFSFRRKSELIA